MFAICLFTTQIKFQKHELMFLTVQEENENRESHNRHTEMMTYAINHTTSRYVDAKWLKCMLIYINACKTLSRARMYPSARQEIYTHNYFTALFLGQPEWAGARRELLDFMVHGEINRRRGEINRCRHTDHPTGRHSIQPNQCPPPPSAHIFYGLDALPATQPTVSKHWRQEVRN